MKTIYALDVNSAKNEVLNSFIKLMLPHVVANEVIQSEFKPQVAELQTQAQRFADALENHRFSLLSEKVTAADTRRDKEWTAAKAVIVAEMENPDAAHRVAAQTINKLFDSFGKIRNMGLAEQSGAMSSLCNDLLKNHSAELELTSLKVLIEGLQAANNEFIAAYDERTESRSEVKLGETREAKQALITAYRTLIFLLNARILQKGSEGLEDFIAYANTLIRQYRPMVGQKPAPGQDESLDEGLEDEELDGDVDDGDLGDGDNGDGSVPPTTGGNGGSGSGTTPGSSTGGGSGSTGSEEKFTVAWYLPNGNPIIWYELAPGETIPEAPECPEGYYWHPYPSTMPNHDLDIIPEPIKG